MGAIVNLVNLKVRKGPIGVNNKDTRCIDDVRGYRWRRSSVSLVDFEHVNASWVRRQFY